MPSKGINVLRKITKFMAYFLLVIGIIAIVLSIIRFASWQLKKENYRVQDAYSMGGFLVYFEEGKANYIDNIVDVLGQKKELNLPIGSCVKVYVDKINSNSCIYFDINNTFDAFALDPTSDIEIIYVFFLSFLLFVFAAALEEEYVFVMPKALRVFSKIIFLLGILLLIVGIREIKHIIGGIIIAFIGLHFALIDDVGRKEE